MTRLYVDSKQGILIEEGDGYRYQTTCAIGRKGIVSAQEKREGDGKTPLGCWPIRSALLRPDRLSHYSFDSKALPFKLEKIKIPWRWVRPSDGWCDDSDHPSYNQPVTLPFSASAETLWREDGLYDIIITLGYNDSPVYKGRGSAIFLHCSIPDRQTAGCVAVMQDFLQNLLLRLQLGDSLTIF
ncbi:MAG: L,D-transpeptidase family protein [Zymomonas mobilis subsp. pomaceae]|uniref:L,D-transpeptidase family protein n=1 Tax=Zymomonas mobilis TaxID=542 RepID=UPI0039E8F26B